MLCDLLQWRLFVVSLVFNWYVVLAGCVCAAGYDVFFVECGFAKVHKSRCRQTSTSIAL